MSFDERAQVFRRVPAAIPFLAQEGARIQRRAQ